jgi:translocator protein
MGNQKVNQYLKLILSIAIPLGIGGIAGTATVPAIQGWYMALNKPFFNPPNWIFGPVWTALYFLMGVSLYLIWSLPASTARNSALRFFAIQLIFNFGWSFIFFYFKQMGIALIEISMLWIVILLMIRNFHKIRPIAAWINIPYLMWVSFATLLNAAYWWLN